MNALPDDSERPGTVTGLQLDVLRALWRAGEATVTEVHAALQRRRRLAPTTVATLLKRLASKQLVEHRQEGRALVYRALIAEDPDLTSPRGAAARVLLWLMRRDEAVRLMTVG